MIGQFTCSFLPTAGSSRTDFNYCFFSRYLTSPALLYSTSIERDLLSGTLILADRYAFSGIAFSHAKGLPYEWCRSPEISLPAPDLTIFLDISPEHARARGGYGEERYEKEEMQGRVREVFKRMGKEMGRVEVGETRWVGIDAGRPVEEVANDIWNAISPLMHGLVRPLEHLWTEG